MFGMRANQSRLVSAKAKLLYIFHLKKKVSCEMRTIKRGVNTLDLSVGLSVNLSVDLSVGLSVDEPRALDGLLPLVFECCAKVQCSLFVVLTNQPTVYQQD